MVRIKVLCGFFDGSLPPTRVDGKYEFVYDPGCSEYDWLVVFDEMPVAGERLRCPHERTILCTWEPVSIKSYSRAYTRQFGHLLTNRPPEAERHPGYHLGRGYFPWFVHDIPKLGAATGKSNLISAVCSSKQMRHTRHHDRFELVKALAAGVDGFDWYGKGVKPLDRKEDALVSYKYHVAVENHIAPHHWSEKFADAILCECLPFYAGDPALTEVFPPECFIPIPIDDPAEAVRIVKAAIANGEYEKRREAILEAKRLILAKYNFWQQVIGVIESAQGAARTFAGPESQTLYSRRALRRHSLRAAWEDGFGHLVRLVGRNPQDAGLILSVCVPTCNRGAWLEERVRDWLSSPCRGFEVVISDNASTDGSADALAKIRDPRLRLVRNAENVGSFENQLRAFEAAHGRYLMQLTDKDDLDVAGMEGALAELARLDVACGEFALNGTVSGATEVRRGLAAFRRHALRFTHPSGRFFSAAVLQKHGLLAELRGLEPVIRPYSTDFLVALALAHGGYAAIERPFVRMNLPPYPGLVASSSYRDPADYYFTPEFLAREFAAFVRLLRRTKPLGALACLRLVSHLAGGRVFDQMTSWYRWRLENEAMCSWYGVRPGFREHELGRDLMNDAASLLRDLEGVGWIDRLVIRLTAARRARRGKWHVVPTRIGGTR